MDTLLDRAVHFPMILLSETGWRSPLLLEAPGTYEGLLGVHQNIPKKCAPAIPLPQLLDFPRRHGRICKFRGAPPSSSMTASARPASDAASYANQVSFRLPSRPETLRPTLPITLLSGYRDSR
jgi:hypothetical protein